MLVTTETGYSANPSKEDFNFTNSLHGRSGQNSRTWTCGVQIREYAFKSSEKRVWKTLDGLKNGSVCMRTYKQADNDRRHMAKGIWQSSPSRHASTCVANKK